MIRYMKVSIIVPVYNVEKFILKTVESVMNQDYKDVEIILVNDGYLSACYFYCHMLIVLLLICPLHSQKRPYAIHPCRTAKHTFPPGSFLR